MQTLCNPHWQVLPPLVGVVPEARLNLALLHCRRGEPARALDLLRGLEPATALEHICKVGRRGLCSASVHGRENAACHLIEHRPGIPNRFHLLWTCTHIMLQGVAAALQGQAVGSAALVREAAECFSAVGSSPSEQDSVRLWSFAAAP